MFNRDQPQLSALGRSGPDGFERICTFVLLTIRQPLRIACMDYKLVRDGERGPLFGAKSRGLDYVQAHAGDLLDECEECYALMPDDDAECAILHILMRIPGIGPAKAGFIAQMLYGLSGCIDTHNLTRFGLDERHFKMNKALKPARKCAIVRDYNTFCRKVGGAEALWNGWCDYLAARDPINYPSGDAVSRLHLCPLEC